MTLTEFEHGYWYASELKSFASKIGIPRASQLRKEELEASIRGFLSSGELVPPRRSVKPAEPVKDVERGLSLKLPVMTYTNDSETKDFLERESRKLSPEHKQRSGSRYRLNRWRGAANRFRREDHLRRLGARICPAKPTGPCSRTCAASMLYQLPQRFLRGRKRRSES